jgi:di/tricarboxylate transporter
MGFEAVIVLLVIVAAVILFVTEKLPVDLVGILIIIFLVAFGVITPQEGVSGFSNSATMTVAFMFVMSAALLKTGALQQFTPRISNAFRKNYRIGIAGMMLFTAFISAFINNTPVVAVLIPIMIQIGHASGISPSKLLIPISYASIFGGTCTLVGTSTNILVSGIAESRGLEPISMFQLSPFGLIMVAVGILYILLLGHRFLPDRKDENLQSRFGMRGYLAELEIKEGSNWIGKKIMNVPTFRELDLEIIEVLRKNGNRHYLPQGDLRLLGGDILKVKCDVQKLIGLKEQMNVGVKGEFQIAEDGLKSENMALVELVISVKSDFEGKTLRELDFRRKFRSIPLAIQQREEVVHDKLQDVRLKSGDIILAEVKTHYLDDLKRMESGPGAPFVVLSEERFVDFNKRNFIIVTLTMAAIISLAALNLVPIMIGAIGGAAVMALTNCLRMKEFYRAIDWKVVFLLAGALTLGIGMENSGLAQNVADQLIGTLGIWGPVAILSGLYLITSLMTETMSNNATAALLAPIAIATAQTLGLSPVPFIMAVTFAASASFMTPVGYQTNTMIYSAGNYRFRDFLKTGTFLNVLFWILATLLIPILYPF